MKNTLSLVTLSALAALGLALAGCDNGGDLSIDDGTGGDDQADAGPGGGDTKPKTCTDLQTSYTGFGNSKLEVGRKDAPIGTDRFRMKPYSMLTDEYKRVLATTPTVLGESGPTFGQPPDRWYVEPKPGAVALYQAYRVAFEGCLTYTGTDAKYKVAPDATAAQAECTAMETKFWSRTPTPDEVQACVDVAVTDSTMELVPGGTSTKPTDPQRRWSYACASVMTAPGFLSY